LRCLRGPGVLERLEPVAPKVCRLLEEAEEDLNAFYAFPSEHQTKLRSTNPLERASTKRSDAALTSSGSSSTTPPPSASPARCSPTKRRTARPTPLPLRRIDGPDPRRCTGRRELARTTATSSGGSRSQRGPEPPTPTTTILERYTTSDDLMQCFHTSAPRDPAKGSH
jgi:hypothetical protein